MSRFADITSKERKAYLRAVDYQRRSTVKDPLKQNWIDAIERMRIRANT